MKQKDLRNYGAPSAAADIERRKADFLEGLQTLTARTGVVLRVMECYGCDGYGCDAHHHNLVLGDRAAHGRYDGDADGFQWMTDDEIAAREKRRARAEKPTRKAKRAAAGKP